MVGSGIMAERALLGPSSGAHFNPAVSLLVVLGHRRPEDAPWMVSAWIGAAYWFTASTSFANPAITLARSMQGPHSRRANSRETLRPARCAVRPECPGGYGEPPWLS